MDVTSSSPRQRHRPPASERVLSGPIRTTGSRRSFVDLSSMDCFAPTATALSNGPPAEHRSTECHPRGFGGTPSRRGTRRSRATRTARQRLVVHDLAPRLERSPRHIVVESRAVISRVVPGRWAAFVAISGQGHGDFRPVFGLVGAQPIDMQSLR
ncbi:acetyltransferase [Anopheles sinensis]|uniref:Acetyltransferase n=1 Tax=Anopheles sinensis TaxID=74873 RepID=A0A084WT78_ANOSI|nr:acetyltransferase [Anopheles sinensis]